MKRAPFRISIVNGDDRRVLRAKSEREAALMAESVIRRIDNLAGCAGFIIETADNQAIVRISAYLADVAVEMTAASRTSENDRVG